MTTTRISVFPLPGALLFPGMHLPLHIFEPRYRAMISDAMARDRRIGMIQPRLEQAPVGKAIGRSYIRSAASAASSRWRRSTTGGST